MGPEIKIIVVRCLIQGNNVTLFPVLQNFYVELLHLTELAIEKVPGDYWKVCKIVWILF